MAVAQVPAWKLAIYGRAVTGSGQRKTPNAETRRAILDIQSNRCLYCELEFGITIRRGSKMVTLRLNWDHFVPYAYGLTNASDNWVAACHVCNGIKSCRMFDTIGEAQRYIGSRRSAKGYETPVSGEEPPLPEVTVPRIARPRPNLKSRPTVKRANPANFPSRDAAKLPVQRVRDSNPLPFRCPDGCRWDGVHTTHCAVAGCHRNFTGRRAYESHRSQGRCIDPSEIGYVLLDGHAYEVWGSARRMPSRGIPSGEDCALSNATAILRWLDRPSAAAGAPSVPTTEGDPR